MGFIRRVFIGVVIGGAMILPGVSGAVLAVILGVYDKMMYALNHLFKDFKNSIKLLLPLGIGGVVGVLLFSKVLKVIFDSYAVAAQYAFMGFVIGGVPLLVNHVKEKGHKINVGVTMISFMVIVFLLFMDRNHMLSGTSIEYITEASYIKIILSGILLAIGVILPGVSNFQLLMLIGMYRVILNLIAGVPEILFDSNVFLRMIPLGLSFLIAVIGIIKFYNYMEKKHYSLLYSIIIGFVVGAVPVMYPGFSLNMQTVVGIFLGIIGFFIAYNLGEE